MLLSAPVIAVTRMSEISGEFRERVTETNAIDGVWFMLFPIVAIIIAWIVYRLAGRSPTIPHDTNGLFNTLCRQHGIGAELRPLLRRISVTVDAEHPALVFLDAELFSTAIETAQGENPFNDHEQSHLRVIKSKLFS